MSIRAILKSPSKRLAVLLGGFCVLVVVLNSSFFMIDSSSYDELAYRVTGVIDGEVEQKIGTQRFVLNHVDLAGDALEGKLLVQLSSFPRLAYGQTIQFFCRLEKPEPFNGFAYDRYLLSKGIVAVCVFPQYVDVMQEAPPSIIGTLLGIKHALVTRLQAIVSEPHSSFLSGLLFGGSTGLSRDLQDDFSSTGTSHIMAASGFNVSLFSAVLLGWMLTSRIGRKRSLILVAILLAVYTIMAGATPSVLRATLMASILLVKEGMRREVYRPNLLLSALAIMIAFNPLLLLYDPGFQLSFVAVAGILFLSDRLEPYFSFLPKRFGVRESFVASVSATLTTWPIVLYHFGQISALSPLVNLIVLPLVPYAMAFTAVAIAGGFLWVGLGRVLAVVAWSFSNLILRVIKWYAAF
jgi:competence protein ComEC